MKSLGSQNVSVCLSYSSLVEIKHRDLGKKELLLFYISTLHSTIERVQGRNQEAGTQAEVIEDYCFLACSSLFAQLVYL